ncbi:hypothetical protein jhhlp_006042 [Lomentospora prolificans]|uniref:Uncharacterized protein n=1 Tax=Lomentospora prolificans TaxID=41688 RepID=A0A2N3N4T5_9PEZI|nr:hypothetical protein jhhlp_006042 [Lomentospora prolificans]
MDVGAGAAVGGNMLKEVEETSLDEVLSTLRRSLASLTAPSSSTINPTTPQRPVATHQPKRTSIEELDALIARHFRDTLSTQVSITGRALPLIYALITHLVSSNIPSLPSPSTAATGAIGEAGPDDSCGKTVLVVDLEARFDVTRLRCREADLEHVYVYRPPRCISGVDEVRRVVTEGQRWMLYGRHASRGREWWGTVVIGGPGGDINAGWKGWMRVDMELDGIDFGVGGGVLSAEEAMSGRKRVQRVVDEAGWVVSSDWGGFRFREGELVTSREAHEI